MDNPAVETHPNNGKCPVCGLSVVAYGTHHFAEFYDSNGGWMEEGFCSWEHLAEWAAKGNPDFKVYEFEPWTASVGERVMDGLVYFGIASWTLLAGFGFYTLLNRIW